MSEIKLVLVDPTVALCAEWKQHFAGLPDVEVVNGYFEQVKKYDCLVSPANSFGLMDGGVDAAIIRFFGHALMERVQARILEEFLGEQPIGTSILVETEHERHPFLAHTPTMRTPMVIRGTDQVYTAMWALLLAVRSHNLRSGRRIETVLCPGLGTGTGQMPFHEAARQMALAYRCFLNPPKSIGWLFATERQAAIGPRTRA